MTRENQGLTSLVDKRKAVCETLQEMYIKLQTLKKQSGIYSANVTKPNQMIKLAQDITTLAKSLKPNMQKLIEQLQESEVQTLATKAMENFALLAQSVLEMLMQCMCQTPKPVQKILRQAKSFIHELEQDFEWLNDVRLDEQNKPRWSMY